jgi:hypothetical protein
MNILFCKREGSAATRLGVDSINSIVSWHVGIRIVKTGFHLLPNGESTMSYAWEKLLLAVQCLAKDGSQRDRLTAAMAGHLVCLRPKELPAEVRQKFAALIDDMCHGRVQEKSASVRRMIEGLDDHEVDRMSDSIIRIYDAVARYQPILPAGETP